MSSKQAHNATLSAKRPASKREKEIPAYKNVGAKLFLMGSLKCSWNNRSARKTAKASASHSLTIRKPLCVHLLVQAHAIKFALICVISMDLEQLAKKTAV